MRGETRVTLEAIAKGLHYPDRNYPTILRLAERTDLQRSEIAALQDWLPRGRVDQKRDDALLMLHRIAENARAGWAEREWTSVLKHRRLAGTSVT
jgi:hypothetical protein